MKEILSEIKRIGEIMGVTINEDSRSKEEHMQSITDNLVKNNLYSKSIEKTLDDIIRLGDEQLIDYSLLERGFDKILKMRGNTKKNVETYFKQVFKSLSKRQRAEYDVMPDMDDYSFEPEEPSIIPKKTYRKELFLLQVELNKLTEWLNKTGKTVIIVFEGRDSAGKGSTIKKFVENINPRSYNVIALGIPTPEERKNWWERYRSKIQQGKINLFDRSWYNRGLVEPVAGYGTPEEYEDFMNGVSEFEEGLTKEGDYLFKLWFSIDKETQSQRFQMRQKSPIKYWKYSPNDAKMQDLWDKFTEYKDKLFDKTSTLNNPWVVLDAVDKRVSGLNSIRYVLKNIPYEGKNNEVLDVEYPEAMVVLKPEN